MEEIIADNYFESNRNDSGNNSFFTVIIADNYFGSNRN